AQDRRQTPVSARLLSVATKARGRKGTQSLTWCSFVSLGLGGERSFNSYAATAAFAGALSGESSFGFSENPSFSPKMNSTNAIAPIANNVSPGIRSHRSVAISGVPMNSGLLAYQ